MRTFLCLIILLAFAQHLSAQEFEGKGYIKVGAELLGPVQVKQNLGATVSIGVWPNTTVFFYDEYTAVLDANQNVLFKGGMPVDGKPGSKFLTSKEEVAIASLTPSIQEEENEAIVAENTSINAPSTDEKPEKKGSSKRKKNEPKKKEDKKKKNRQENTQANPFLAAPVTSTYEDTNSVYMGGYERVPRTGFGVVAGNFRAGGVDGYGYGVTANRTFPINNRFRVGAAIDAIVFHDYIFKETVTDYYDYDDEGNPIEGASYKFPEGFAGTVQLRPFAGVDFGCIRAGYQPIVGLNYHSIWGTNVDLYPLGVGVSFLRGPIQVDFFAAMQLNKPMYYSRSRIFGAAVTYGNRSVKRN